MVFKFLKKKLGFKSERKEASNEEIQQVSLPEPAETIQPETSDPAPESTPEIQSEPDAVVPEHELEPVEPVPPPDLPEPVSDIASASECLAGTASPVESEIKLEPTDLHPTPPVESEPVLEIEPAPVHCADPETLLEPKIESEVERLPETSPFIHEPEVAPKSEEPSAFKSPNYETESAFSPEPALKTPTPDLDIQPASDSPFSPPAEPEPVSEIELSPADSLAPETVSASEIDPASERPSETPHLVEPEAQPESADPLTSQLPNDEKAPVRTKEPDPDTAEPSSAPEIQPPPLPETAPLPTETGLFSKLKSGLSKTRKLLNTDITGLFASSTVIDDALFDELEERLITADLGIDITMVLMDRIRQQAKKLKTGDQLKAVLKKELLGLFPDAVDTPAPAKPHVIMMVGVNGTGKTTTLGKLAMRYKRQGKKVLIGAADTFRAAAIEQVEVWADRAGAGIVRHKEGADPAAVAYDTVEAAMARNVDVVLIDTAGRLHTQKNLMEELKKIKRAVNKKFKSAPHEVMLVIDATTGQNAMSQAKIFNEAVDLTQISVTKLDGTAKGGIVAAVSSALNLPIAYIGVGEAIEDLQDFDAKKFIDALFD